jgi:hypothetical protein
VNPLSPTRVRSGRAATSSGSRSSIAVNTSRSPSFGSASAYMIDVPVGVHTRYRRSRNKQLRDQFAALTAQLEAAHGEVRRLRTGNAQDSTGKTTPEYERRPASAPTWRRFPPHPANGA